MYLVIKMCTVQLTSGAPTENLSFWQEEPCTINNELSKSFNESKKYCSLVNVREVKTSEQILCTKLEEDFKELCKSGIKGSASVIPLVNLNLKIVLRT